MATWTEREYPADMTHEELAEAKQHLFQQFSHHQAEAQRLLSLIGHLDDQIFSRFNMPRPADFSLVGLWQLEERDLPPG